MKQFLAIFLGKIIIFLTRFFKFGGGTTAPGRAAIWIKQDLIKKLSQNFSQGSILISGTNGKTTTAKMVVEILKAANYKVLSNAAGSNLPWGIASTLITNSNLAGKIKADFGVFEVDEALLKIVIPELQPKIVLIGNLFRDQLDRYGEIDTVAVKWREGLKKLNKNAQVLLNADDPTIASLKVVHPNTKFFGIQNPPYVQESIRHAADSIYCTQCGNPYQYRQVYFSHLGRYYCRSCGTQNPKLDFVLENAKFLDHSFKAQISQIKKISKRKINRENFKIKISLTGFYNLYNSLAAVSIALALEIRPAIIQKALQKFSAAFGRQEEIQIVGKKIRMILVKNPTGFNQALEVVENEQLTDNLLLILNDKIADGRDVSWIWDVDFEGLPKIKNLYFSGIRAADIALRLKYAGQKVMQKHIIPEYKRALKVALAKTPKNQTLVILPSYTAMLAARKVLEQEGLVKKFWETE